MNWINRAIKQEEIDRELFRSFERRQVVDQCWRKRGGPMGHSPGSLHRPVERGGLRIPGDLLAAHHRGKAAWCLVHFVRGN